MRLTWFKIIGHGSKNFGPLSENPSLLLVYQAGYGPVVLYHLSVCSLILRCSYMQTVFVKVRRRYTIQTICHIDKRNEPTLHLIFVTQLEFSFSLKSFAEVSNDKLSNGGSLFRPNYQDDQFIQTFHVTSQYLVGSHLCFCKGTIFSFSNTYIFSVKIFIVFLPFMSRKSQNISARICPNTFNHNMRELSHCESTRLFKRRSQYGRSQHLKKIASPGPLPSRQRSLLLPATRLESVKYRVLDFTLPEFILHAVSPLKSWLCDYSLPA